ncbi:MAG: allantoate amidohydrolase [Azospirillaceae bacterium]|nr:allantoate amidohydrolase [Azospirillaceae bacterium]
MTDRLLARDRAAFIARFGGVFEHAPWIAAAVWDQAVAAASPADAAAVLDDAAALAEAMAAVWRGAGDDRQRAVIADHPDLAGTLALAGDLTADSTTEQAGAGLDRCSPAELARFQHLNSAYRERFGFPFIMAVRGRARAEILAAFEQRLSREPGQEFATAVDEVEKIARLRLASLAGPAEPPDEDQEPLSAAVILARIDALARVSEDPGALTRLFLTPEHARANALVASWMRAAGMTTSIDAIGNVVGRYEGVSPDLSVLMLGSHLDTVRDAGRFDGMLGVICAIACVADLHRRRVRLPFAIEVLGFGDEEGVRFATTLLGSRAVAGTFDPAVLMVRDANGVTLEEALWAFGLDPSAIGALARQRSQVLAYIELHIEQGPVLERHDLPVGCVTAISGASRFEAEMIGVAGHAGTVPMADRYDALAAAAESILAIERRCAAEPGLVGTVGRIAVAPGAINVIPGRATFTLDLRAPDDRQRHRAAADLEREMAAIAARRGVVATMRQVHSGTAVPCDERLMMRIEAAIAAEGITPLRLPSGAGHDGMAMAALTDVGMLFVRCSEGISHNPAEAVRAADVAVAVRVLLGVIEGFGTVT